MTFTAAQQQEFSAKLSERVTRNQTEILDATREFTSGWEAQAGECPDLRIAIAAMEAALTSLSDGEAMRAAEDEQVALGSLIRARQNIRQVLSQSNSSSSACRTFDRQQTQRLRKPEQPKQDQNQQVAEVRQEIENLAQQQRQWSEEIQSGRKPQLDSDPEEQDSSQQPDPQPATAQSSNSANSSNSQSQPPSPSELAARQQEMLDAWQKLRDKLNALPEASDNVQAQAAQISDSMQRGLDAQQQGSDQQAADEAQSAADMLDQLADHLAASQSSDVLERLSQSQQLAKSLAQGEKNLREELESKSGQQPSSDSRPGSSNAGRPAPMTDKDVARFAQRQERLATQGGLLAEQLSRLRGEATVSDPRAADALERVMQAHSPADIAREMELAGSEIRQDQQSAQATLQSAQQRLDELAGELQSTRTALAQPKLEELIALEQELARTIEQLQNEQTAATLADTDLNALERKLAELAATDRRLAEALNSPPGEANSDTAQPAEQGQTTPGSSNGETKSTSTANNSDTAAASSDQSASGDANYVPGGDQPVRPGFYTRSRWMTPGRLRQANTVVQRKIQEIILSGVQMDGDAAVPPQYAPLIEEYYRQLSDDLR